MTDLAGKAASKPEVDQATDPQEARLTDDSTCPFCDLPGRLMGSGERYICGNEHTWRLLTLEDVLRPALEDLDRVKLDVTPCSASVDCPRCSGCGYGGRGRDGWCQDCADKIATMRPTCGRCHGTGRVRCEITHLPTQADGSPHGTLIPLNGAVGDHCDKPTPPGDGGCPDCWTPLPTNHADVKALFAGIDLGLDTPNE